MERIDAFKGNLKAAGIIDPEKTHHVFKSGMHGQKIDFDLIETGTDLYDEWVGLTAEFVEKLRGNKSELLVFGVANGTNRLAIDVARCVPGVRGFITEKDEEKRIHLTRTGRKILEATKPFEVVFLEDVSTTGSSSLMPALEARELGVQAPRVLTTWQRRPELEKLDEAGIGYSSVIYEPLPTYTPEECLTLPEGFCAQEWKLIER